MLNEYPLNLSHDYQIDPAFNKNLVFAYQALPEINASKLPNLNTHWLEDLETLICQADPAIQEKIFDKHVGEVSNYRAKTHLKKQLQLICHRLQGNLDSELGQLSLDERKALINKLTEEISYCSEGFHNRVNIIVDLFYKPRNLSELLCLVRKEMIEEVASVLTDEIHAWNRVSVIAANDGLGVRANFPEDYYPGSLSDTSIRRALQKSFQQRFTPFHLPSLLISAFIKFIPELEIERNNEYGLSLEMKEKIITLIQRFLPEYINEIPNHPNHELNYFEIVKDKKSSLSSLVNINLEKLYQSFFNALSYHKYFENPKINTLVDCAYSNLFLTKTLNDTPNLLIAKLFKEEKYSDLLEQLIDLSTRFPNYYQQVSKIKVFNKNCLVFIDYLTRQLKINHQYLSQTLLGFQLLINLDLRRKNFLIEKIADTLLLTNQSGFNLLMFAAQHNSALVKEILVFLNTNKKIIDPELTKKIFLMKNKDNLNALMIAAMHHPESLETMLEFIGQNIKNFANNLQAIFLEKHNDHNLLMLAASKEAVDILVRFFNKYIYSYTKKIFFNLFTQQEKNSDNVLTLTARNHPDYINNILESIINYLRIDGEVLNSSGACTMLMLAAKNQAEATFSILDFISKNIQKFDLITLEKMFLEKNQDGFTILMLAARYQPKALEFILGFINAHYNLFSEAALPKMFLEKNSENYTSLMLAVEFQPNSVLTILNFIHSRIEYFKPHLLDILLAKNTQGCNTLVLARRHPTVIADIFNFINANSADDMGSITLELLLLEKLKSGFTLLMYTARDKPESLDFIFEFIKKHVNQFSDETLYRLILEKNTLDYNSLMLAARNQYTAVSTIINFIQQRPKIFSASVMQQLFLEPTKEGINTLMVAAQYQPEAVKIILNFIQSKPDIFSPDFLNQLLVAHDKYGVNALMLAATYQANKVVELLLSFVTKNIQHININTLQEFIFKNIHDKQAANAVFFGGGYNFRKTVLSVTSQLEDSTAVNALLRFVDEHIEVLGIQIFTQLLTEQDRAKNYIFNPACSRSPHTMKKILNFIATPPHCEELKLIHPLVADFIFEQLVRWPIKTLDDENLFDKLICNYSTLLLNHFNVDRFGEYCDNLKKVTESLFSHLLRELELKKTKEQNQSFLYRLFSYTEQELQAAKFLKTTLKSPRRYKKLAVIKNLENSCPKFFKSKSTLSCLYAAFIKTEELKLEKMCELHHENDDALTLQRFQA